MDLWQALLILAGVVGALGLGVVVALVASLLFLTPIALFLFIWRRIFPFARSIAEWTANRVNMIPFFLFMQLLIIPTGTLLIIWSVCYYFTGHFAFLILALLLVPILGLELVIFGVPMGLAIIKLTMDLNHHMFDRFRTQFLTFAFGMVMRIAARKQEKAAMPPKAKRRWRPKRRQNKAANLHSSANKRPQNKANNAQKKAENPHSSANRRPQNKANNAQKKAENPHSSANSGPSANRRQPREEEPQSGAENPHSSANKRRWRPKRRR